jgi:hypothetical protein
MNGYSGTTQHGRTFKFNPSLTDLPDTVGMLKNGLLKNNFIIFS